MKKLTYITLFSAIFAVLFIDITTQIQLPILNAFQPKKDVLSEYIGTEDGTQKLKTAIDIYIKHQKINQQIPPEEKSLVEALMSRCQQKSTLFDKLRQRNSCSPLNLKNVLILILEKSSKIPVIG